MTEANISAYFQGGLVPTWLADFTSEPEQAVSSLLGGAMPLDHLTAAEPSMLLLDWLEMLAEDSDFPRALDEALASWIDAQWDDTLAVGDSASLTAVAWTRACEIIAYAPQLIDAAAQLRRRVSSDRTFLRDLSEGRARDPEGLAWFALARTQTDDRLLQDWWRLCNLDPGVPWYHGYYGVSGLAGLQEGARKGDLLELCGNGLVRLALALARHVDEGWLREHIARDEFQRTARQFMRSVPFPEKWRKFWRQALQNLEFAEGPAESWAQGLFSGGLQGPSPSRDGRRSWFLPDRDWAKRAGDIRAKLSGQDDTTLKAAEDLLAEQRAYAERTGDWGSFVKSACSFSTKVRDTQPTRAAEWAGAALRVEPSNPYTWTTLAKCLVELQSWPESENLYLEATERFPNNEYTYNGLGHTLRAQNKLEEAEGVYRLALQRFPDSEHTHTGLAETLRAQNKLEEAEGVYREALKRFRDDEHTHNGLAETLQAQNKLEEAEEVYRRALTRFPNNEHTHNGLAWTLRAQNKLEKAEVVYRRALKRFPNNEYTHNGLAETLRAQNKLEEAEGVYREARKRIPDSEYAHNGLGHTLRAQNKLEEAEGVYRQALKRFPNNEYTHNGLAETLRARNKLEEAEGVYREARKRIPDSEYAHNGLGHTLRAQNKLEEAEGVYRRALKRFPNNEYTHNGLAETLQARNKLEEAEGVYREARERFPDNEYTHNGLGQTLRAQNKLEEAEGVYREALERFPQSADVRTGLERVRSLLASTALPLEQQPPQTSSPADEEGETGVKEVVDNTPPPYEPPTFTDAEQAAPTSTAPPLEQQPPQTGSPADEEGETAVDEVVDDTPPPYELPTSADAEQAYLTTVEQEAFGVTASEPAGPDQGLRDQDLRTLLSEAAFVRRLSRLVGWSGEGQGSRIVRERARDLLHRIPDDAQRLGSEGSTNVALMRLDEKEVNEALVLLREAVRRFPGNVRVQYALARAQREVAERERNALDLGSAAQIAKPWRRLSRLDRRMDPVSWLGEARTLFAYVDGATIENGARDVLGKLAKWTSQPQRQQDSEDYSEMTKSKTQTQSLAKWWSGQLRSHLFPSGVTSAAEIADVGALRSALSERSELFDSLEENWVRSVSATGTLPPNLPGS